MCRARRNTLPAYPLARMLGRASRGGVQRAHDTRDALTTPTSRRRIADGKQTATWRSCGPPPTGSCSGEPPSGRRACSERPSAAAGGRDTSRTTRRSLSTTPRNIVVAWIPRRHEHPALGSSRSSSNSAAQLAKHGQRARTSSEYSPVKLAHVRVRPCPRRVRAPAALRAAIKSTSPRPAMQLPRSWPPFDAMSKRRSRNGCSSRPRCARGRGPTARAPVSEPTSSDAGRHRGGPLLGRRRAEPADCRPQGIDASGNGVVDLNFVASRHFGPSTATARPSQRDPHRHDPARLTTRRAPSRPLERDVRLAALVTDRAGNGLAVWSEHRARLDLRGDLERRGHDVPGRGCGRPPALVSLVAPPEAAWNKATDDVQERAAESHV